jgi:Domain of unknown function (DUF4082)
MTQTWVLGNFTASNFADVNGGGAVTVATSFSVATDQALTGIRWYRYLSGSTAPAHLHVYEVPSGDIVYTPASIPDNGTGGQWQTISFTDGPTLVAGTEYRVAMSWGGGQNSARYTLGSIPAPDGPMLLSDNCRAYLLGSEGYPNSVDNVFLHGIDAAIGSPTGGTGGSGGATDADLATWLSTDDSIQTHEADGIPWETHTLQTGATGFDAIKAVADAIAAAVSGLPGTIAGAVTTITGQLTDMTGTMFDTGIATIGSISHDMQIVMSDALHTFSGLAGGAPGATSGRTAFPTELWTLVAEDDFDGCAAIATAADMYVVSITNPPRGKAVTTLCGVDLIFRAGWWSQLNGSFATERHFLDYVDNHLQDGGRRMPGALIVLEPEGTGHWQAWQLT